MQEIRFLDLLPSGRSSALGNLNTFLCTRGNHCGLICRRFLFARVIRSRRNIRGLMMNRNLNREGCKASSHFLLVAFPLLLVHSYCEAHTISKDVLVYKGRHLIQLRSTPPISEVDFFLGSSNKPHNQSGYSKSSLANISGLFLK